MKRGYGKSVYIRRRVKKYWPLYLFMLPVFLFFIIYHYIPMGGLVMVFKNYRIARGLFASDWSGLRNFERLFSAPAFPMVIRNTVVISLLKLTVGFPAPIILALLLNELRSVAFKRSLQTVLYLPHFVSWVILGGLINTFFGPSTGVIPLFLSHNFGVSLDILMKPVNFVGMLVVSDIWKEIGWSSIIYLAAITGIDTELYEAATVDGANRFQQLIKITLPCLMPIIMTMVLLRIGGILNAGFEQIFILQNSLVYNLSEILDTYVYKLFLQGEYAISATAGLFKAIVGLILVLITNKMAERYEQGVL